METPLATRSVENGALAVNNTNPIAPMLQAIMEKGITADSVVALEKMTDLYERMEKSNAQKAFAQAFASLQAEMRPVQAMKPVPNKDGSLRYLFAPYEDIMRQVSPVLERHGFSVSFTCTFDQARMKVVCTLTHRSGHSQSNECSVRIGQGPPGATDTQADGAARSYARRLALCDALNIVVERDNDARDEGSPITQAQADDLRRRVEALGADQIGRFLRFAGVERFEDIHTTAYRELLAGVQRREEAAKKSTAATDGPAPVPETAQHPDPICGYSSAGDWRAACIEQMKAEGWDATKAGAWIDHQCKAMKAGSYLSTTEEQRRKVWGWIIGGKAPAPKQ